MAKKNIQDTSQNKTNTFVKGLNKDSDPTFIAEGMWTHARNAVNNTLEGGLGTLSNETSNVYCVEAGATMSGKKYIIGTVHLYSDKWIIFTVAYPLAGVGTPTGHEIGLFEEDRCKYRIIVQDDCLNFDKRNLITGASREKEDCSWGVYFADGLNPDRYLNIGDDALWPDKNYEWIGNNKYGNTISGATLQWPGVQWNQLCHTDSGCQQISPGIWPPACPGPNDCITCEDTTTLNCEDLRLARLMSTPTLQIKPGVGGGVLRNGSYFAVLAYTIKGQRVTDYFSPSNTQPLWNVDDVASCIDIFITADTVHFEEFELVVVQIINQGAVAKRIGLYSTSTSVIHLDQIKDDLITIPIEQIPLRNVVYETSDQMTEVNNYLLRIAPRSKFDFNYQPLANLIETQWISVEYPADYYVQGGSNTSYLRDEVYCFFIRWIYSTGDKSSSYHIPGKFATPGDTAPSTDQNALSPDDRYFEVYNTATLNPASGTLPDGGTIIAKGQMGYWESTEKYPDNRHDIWDASSQCWTGTTDPQYDLCGKQIRHHKFPDNITQGSKQTNHYADGGNAIRLMGVNFKNIILPKDNDGNDIPGIEGYEILRGSREGNRSIIAKGMLNNMRTYDIKGNNTAGRKGLYPNYPFNTITPLSTSISGNVSGVNDPYIKLTDKDDNIINQTIPTNIVTFHSPDTNFRTPFLSVSELKLYGSVSGTSIQYFQEPDQHPKNKLISNLTMWAIIVGGIIEAITQSLGKRSVNQPGASFQRQFGPDVEGDAIGGGGGTISGGGTLAPWVNGSGATVPISGSWTDLNGGKIDTNATPQEYTDKTEFEGNILKPLNKFNAAYSIWMAGGGIAEAFLPAGVELNSIYKNFDEDGGLTKGGIYTAPSFTQEVSGLQLINGGLNLPSGFNSLLYFFSVGADTTLKLIYALLPYRQYALQAIAEGYYNNFNVPNLSQVQRFNIDDSFYLKNNIQNVKTFSGTNYVINNLKRQTSVTLRTTDKNNNDVGPDYITTPGIEDKSLVTLGTVIQAGFPLDMDTKRTDTFNLPIASHYAGIKVRLRNQYGQLDSVKQIPITPSEQKFGYNGENIPYSGSEFICIISTPNGNRPVTIVQKTIQETPIFFGGDTYVNRYTEKNNMFFFYDWLYGQPDGYEYNYILRHMIAEPRFWVNSINYETSDLFSFVSANWVDPNPGTGVMPTAFYNLDYFVDNGRKYDYNNDTPTGGFDTYPGIFGVRQSVFYLANSSVRDFFVESDVLVDFREPGTAVYEQHYDHNTYTNLPAMFNMNPDTVARGNYYAYDYSLSISKVFTQYFSQGNLQSRFYNPVVSQLCYTYYPDRIVYSLPQQNESSKDSWFIYLVNNYKEFKNRITSVKAYAKTGMFITFQNSSPLMYQGVDTLQTELGTKLTIGDGGLFANPPQNVTIADVEYEYGSSQNKFGVIATPAGMYYISQNQGRIFAFENGLKEISQQGMKWWFNIFLPYKLIEDFPDYPHTDNPVAGIGTQAVYDNYNGVIYFSKKDYKIKPEYINRLTYDRYGDFFLLDGQSRLELGNPLVFEDASWTASFDPKNDYWISFHDWHPDFTLAARQFFMTTKEGRIWKHNAVCNSYCNFYGVQHPFEIEIPLITGQTITTLKSMEYVLECYKNTSSNCVDQFHVLDFNFDKAVVTNSEQVSGYLNLNIFPKNNITLANTYPKINPTSIDILFSKEENKYRFNQFWDITNNRGEFPNGSAYPPTGTVVPGTTQLAGIYTQESIWNTQSNGYIKTLNTTNLNYNKTELQRKKFRHYLNFLYLTRADSKDVNMIVKLTNSKNQISLR